jgi:hypothetical protein
MRRPRVSYELDATSGRFIVEDYNWARPFSSFLPGIAGPWGIPMWVFYVNRGQAVCSAGVRDKNGQIIEFQSFNLATARVAHEGFRTFIRLDGGELHEPLQKTRQAGVRQTMEISPAELVLRERCTHLGIELEVVYFTLSNLGVPGLVREVRLRNLRDAPRAGAARRAGGRGGRPVRALAAGRRGARRRGAPHRRAAGLAGRPRALRTRRRGAAPSRLFGAAADRWVDRGEDVEVLGPNDPRQGWIVGR